LHPPPGLSRRAPLDPAPTARDLLRRDDKGVRPEWEDLAMTFRRRTLLRALPAIPAAFAGPAVAQAWPTRPIRIVVPFPAGGTTDMLARLLAQGMTATLGQSVVVENRGGGGGSIGADVVAKAAPDGYTLLFHNLTFTTTSAMLAETGRAPHDMFRDFAPVSLAANVPFILLAAATVPAGDLRGFAAWAKAQPAGSLNYGSTGPGSTMNLLGELYKRDAGITMEHIPFRGAAPLVQEMLAGRIQFGGDQISTSLGHVRGGALKALATTADRRTEALPDVATVAEQGFPNLAIAGWNGFFAPAGTPASVIERINAAVREAIAQPDAARRMREVAAEPVGSSPAELDAVVRAQSATVRPLVASFGFRLE
jgi:tripartite-type tricarboxylate transporter receptor subunit TctC